LKYKVKKYKSTRKYRCPFCRLTATRGDLAAHVEKEHEDMIPEGYNGTRVVYDYINKKNYGTCLICKQPVYEWDDNVARYKNICNRPECMEALKKKAQGNHFDDPEVQKKMLAARKISGSYKFRDGTVHSYVGTYELRCYEFMDSIGIQGKDIMSPGPTIYYEYKGETHPWILDWMYIPAMLCCDVKDGGSNPNNRPMLEYREKQLAKEAAIEKNGQYNYIRLTDNNFGQLLSALADIRYGTINHDPINHIYINESTVLTERNLIDEEDIYYNKDKWDKGEINLCFITGLGGSGKSTMANDIKAETYSLDDLYDVPDYTDKDMKNHGDMFYSFFTGAGKKYRIPYKLEDWNSWGPKNGFKGDIGECYYKPLIKTFVNYAKAYASSHKSKRFVIEGIALYTYIEPAELRDYAVFIKGTSAAKSFIRSLKRDVKNTEGLKGKISFTSQKIKNAKFYLKDEKIIDKWRNYYRGIKNEAYLTEAQKIIKGTLKDMQKITDTLTGNDEGKGNKLKEQKETIYRDIQYASKDHGGWVEMYSSKDSTKDCQIASIAIDVDPEARGTGLSDRLINGAKASMKKLGIDRIEWYCKKTNIGSYKLAKRCGFKEEPKLCNKEWYTLYYGKEVKLEVSGGMPSAHAHADYIIPRMMSGIEFDGRTEPAYYFGNTGSEYLVSFDPEMNPMFDEKQKKLIQLSSCSRIVCPGNKLTTFTEKQLREMGEQGLLEALIGHEFNGWRSLFTEGIVKVSEDIDNDFARILVVNGLVQGVRQAFSEAFEVQQGIIDTKGSVTIHRDNDGFFATTPEDFFLTSNHYETVDELMDVVDLMNSMYDHKQLGKV